MSAQAMYAHIERHAQEETPLRHAPLVKRIAYHLLGRLPACVQVEDLIQAGMIGLLDAVKNFDPAHGVSFDTFAGIRIRGAMLDEIRKGDWTPRSVHRQARQLANAMQRVETRNGVDASDRDVASEMGISLEEYHHIVRDAQGCRLFSLETSDTASDYQDRLVARTGQGPDTVHHEAEFRQALTHSIEKLPEKERVVMSLYYDDEMNLREIGEVLGVSESRVSQIHGQALIRLRSRLCDWLDY